MFITGGCIDSGLIQHAVRDLHAISRLRYYTTRCTEERARSPAAAALATPAASYGVCFLKRYPQTVAPSEQPFDRAAKPPVHHPGRRL
jgi:hypothetical protein